MCLRLSQAYDTNKTNGYHGYKPTSYLLTMALTHES
jgi:hypothetical protein